jgi:hypothetical protein
VALFERPPCPYNTRIVPTRTLIQDHGRGLSWLFPIYPTLCHLFFIPHLPPTIGHLRPFFSTTFPLYANISFVFIYIPAKPKGVSRPSFVFNNIPALCRQKEFFFGVDRAFLGRRTNCASDAGTSRRSTGIRSPSPSPCLSSPTYHLPHTNYRIINNISALYSYLLCFHRHSRFIPKFYKVVLCFQ